MKKEKYNSILISDFNNSNLNGLLANNSEFPAIKNIVAPYGQVNQVLMDFSLDCWQSNLDFAFIWTRPEAVIPSFADVLKFKKVNLETLLSQVDQFSANILNISTRVKWVFVPTWVVPTYDRGYGMLDMKNGVGRANILMRMNLRLAENLEKSSNIYLLNSGRWIETAGLQAFNVKLWYMGKIPFSQEVFKEAVKDIKASLSALSGLSKKLIILDLDNTLWGGIVGDDGWKNIKIGGHDFIGEAFLDFQAALKSLTNRGILLAIASKNEEKVALEAIGKHPEMILHIEDFAGWRINWQDKAKNIVELVEELNLGLESVVFIDDNPVERARVRDTLPQVFVPDWPEDKMLYKSTLLDLSCFDNPMVSIEDQERTKMYRSEKQRKELMLQIGSLEQWLKSLDVEIKIENLGEINLARTVQLLNKTNQMNLSTRRMSEQELLNWSQEENNKIWVFYVADRFGKAGLTGIIGIKVKDKVIEISDFVLSCRVMGRKVEETMLYTVIAYAASISKLKVCLKYLPTSKNKPFLNFLENSGLVKDKNIFTWETKTKYIIPDCIKLEGFNLILDEERIGTSQ